MLDNQYFHIQRNQKQNIRYTRSRPFDASRNMLVKHRNAVDYTCSSSCGLTLQSKNVKSTKMLIKVVNELIIRHKLSGKCSFQRSICYKKGSVVMKKIYFETKMTEMPKTCTDCECQWCRKPCKKGQYESIIKVKYTKQRHEDCPLKEFSQK